MPAALAHHRHTDAQPGALAFRIFGIILLMLGVPQLLIAGHYAHLQQQRQESWIHAEAVVTSVSRHSPGSGDASYHYPHFTFTAQDGQNHTVSSSMGSNPPAYAVGDRVEVIYPADLPADAEINFFWEIYFFSIVLGALGVLMVLTGMILLVVASKLRKNPTNLNVGDVDLPSGAWLTGGGEVPTTYHGKP